MARMIDPTIAIGHTHVVTLPVDRFDIEPGFNIRIEREELTAHIRSIADSMKHHGYDQTEPVVVRWENDRAIIREGHCRLTAVKLANEEGAGILGIPCISEPKGVNPVVTILRPVTANSGLAPMPLEKAVAVRKALDSGWTEKQVADHCGMSVSWVEGLMALNGAALPIQQAVKDGELSSTIATQLARQGTKASVATLEQARAARPAGTKRITAATVAKVREAATTRITGPRMNDEQKVLDRCLPVLASWMARTTVKGLVTDDVREVMEKLAALLPATEAG